MEFHVSCLLIALISSFGLVAASTSPAMFWTKTLPNTPMPNMIKDMLDSNEKSQGVNKKSRDPKLILDGCSPILVAYEYKSAATEEEVNKYKKMYGKMFLLRKEMTPGSTVKMLWTSSTTPATDSKRSADKITFLPRDVSDSIPLLFRQTPRNLQATLRQPRQPRS